MKLSQKNIFNFIEISGKNDERDVATIFLGDK